MGVVQLAASWLSSTELLTCVFALQTSAGVRRGDPMTENLARHSGRLRSLLASHLP